VTVEPSPGEIWGNRKEKSSGPRGQTRPFKIEAARKVLADERLSDVRIRKNRSQKKKDAQASRGSEMETGRKEGGRQRGRGEGGEKGIRIRLTRRMPASCAILEES